MAQPKAFKTLRTGDENLDRVQDNITAALKPLIDFVGNYSAPGSSSGIPSGIVSPYAGASAPDGWLICDGSNVSRSIYPDLYSAIGTSFGNGDGLTTFTLPDMRGKFARGVDGSAGNDPDASTRIAQSLGGNAGNLVGSIQTDAYGSHTHSDAGHSHQEQVVLSGAGGPGFHVQRTSPNSGSTPAEDFTLTDYANIQASGGSETRPKNLYLNFIIKT